MTTFHDNRMAFEEFYLSADYGTEADLDFYCLTDEETKMYPERQGFVSYTSKEVNELFGFFMAGVRYGRMHTEKENQNV